MSLTTLNNAKIENNIIDQGSFSDGITTTVYKYDVHIYSNNIDLTISKNSFLNILAVGDTNASLNTFIRIDGAFASSIIINNYFRRSSSTITSYISSGSGNPTTKITHNKFDTFTTDGTNDVLISGFSIPLYEKNTNQIKYIIIPVGSFSNSDGQGANIQTDSNIITATTYSYTTTQITGTGAQIFVTNLNLSNAMPSGLHIQEAKLGVYVVNSGATLSTGSVFFEIRSQDLVHSNYSTGTNSILDAKNNFSTFNDATFTTYDIAANLAAITSNAQFITLTPSSISFYTSYDTSLMAEIVISINCSVAGTFNVYLSPIVLKCSW